MLSVKSVKKKFKGNRVLSNIDLEVREGELIHIKGINGSGKSTLLKIIATLMQPDSGEVVLEKGVKIGALIENPSFIESETMLFNLKFLYKLTGDYDEVGVKKLVEAFELDYHSSQSIKKFSIGMRQKVGIIQALMENQNLILLDEPTRGLDENSIRLFNQLIAQLIEEKKSVIVCAHDGVEGLKFTHTYELRNGELFSLAQV